MYQYQHIQFINLPKIPQEIIDRLPMAAEQYSEKSKYQNYIWSDSLNQEINAWCKYNICNDIYWGFQLMTADLAKHQDQGTKTKFTYLLSSGGDHVYTKFWSDDRATLLNQYVLPLQQWHILKADTVHSVEGIAPGNLRFSVTGRIF